MTSGSAKAPTRRPATGARTTVADDEDDRADAPVVSVRARRSEVAEELDTVVDVRFDGLDESALAVHAVTQSVIPIVVVDGGGIIRHVSRAAEELHPWTPGRPLADIVLSRPTSRVPMTASEHPLSLALRGITSADQTLVLRSEDTVQILVATATPILDERGGVAGATFVLRPVRSAAPVDSDASQQDSGTELGVR